MTANELGKLYIELALKSEENYFTECGFASATEARAAMYLKIIEGRLSRGDIEVLAPLFESGDVDLRKHVKIPKRFFLF